ncbi:hypothetical protein QVD17_25738 [Tagetes erecta]|uniref:RRM domain-containing protein n=1 Tax=Tagetes erecta TaxID=13708 RepID=A0AAD8KGC5_TARER|nr:hypothetical protein QVD17_25738 [Tagetes erecta]
MAGNGMHQYQHQHQRWASPSPPVSLGGEEVRTIFISGLPEDVKERELQNLLRWLPGYEASQVNFKADVPMGFALFSAPHFAIAARDALQDMLFDSESNSVLHTEMAKKNLFVKRGIVADPNSFDQSKRMRTGGDYTHTGFSSPSPFHPPPAPVWGPHGYMAPPPPTYDPYGAYPVSQVPMAPPPTLPTAPVPAPSSYMPVQNTKDNPPCNTLFIGNLGENINEEELRGLFSMQPGFKQMKVLRQERHTVCFIEFEDVNSATNVHHSLQGAVIPSAGSVGMRIQYPYTIYKRSSSTHRMHIAAVHASIISSIHDKCIRSLACQIPFDSLTACVVDILSFLVVWRNLIKGEKTDSYLSDGEDKCSVRNSYLQYRTVLSFYDSVASLLCGMNTKDNPPCNTLFIGNLGENINEEELRGLFSMQPGFKQMKVLRQERHTVCFIEFEQYVAGSRVLVVVAAAARSGMIW